jgi:hypothetical protein
VRPAVDCDWPVVLQVKYDDLPGGGIYDPVFTHTCFGILVELESDVLSPGGGGENLYDKVRSPIDPAVAKFVPVTYDQNVGLDDRILVIVQDNVNWRGQRNAGAFAFFNMIPQTSLNLKDNHLVECCGAGHVIEDPIDQLDTLIIGKGQIILEREDAAAVLRRCLTYILNVRRVREDIIA